MCRPARLPIPADIFAQTPRFERVEDYRTTSGQVSLVAAPWQRFSLRAWVYRNQQREERNRYDDATYSSMDDPLVQGTFQSNERSTVTGSSALAQGRPAAISARCAWSSISVARPSIRMA